MDLIKTYDEVETMSGCSYLEDKLNDNNDCKAAVTARARISWVIFETVESCYLEISFC